MNKFQIAISLILGMIALGGCCHGPKNGEKVFIKTTIKQLSEKPNKYENKSVEITGYLRNAGVNYFTDIRLVLEDGLGNAVSVRPWLPLEVPPPRPGVEKRPRPKMMSDYLGKKLIIKGLWQSEEEKHILMVDEAIILEIKEK